MRHPFSPLKQLHGIHKSKVSVPTCALTPSENFQSSNKKNKTIITLVKAVNRKRLYSQVRASTWSRTQSSIDATSIARQREVSCAPPGRCASNLNGTASHLLGLLIVPVSVSMVTLVSGTDV